MFLLILLFTSSPSPLLFFPVPCPLFVPFLFFPLLLLTSTISTHSDPTSLFLSLSLLHPLSLQPLSSSKPFHPQHLFSLSPLLFNPSTPQNSLLLNLSHPQPLSFSTSLLLSPSSSQPLTSSKHLPKTLSSPKSSPPQPLTSSTLHLFNH